MKKRTILIADDRAVNRKILRAMFEEQYHVSEAKTGQDVLNLTEQCSLILLSVRLCRQQDADLLRQLNERRIPKQTPILLIADGAASDSVLYAYEMGVSEVIYEPFLPEVLLKRADNLIRLCDRAASYREADSFELDFKSVLMNSRVINLFWKDKHRRFAGANRKFLDTYGFPDVSAILGKTDEDMGWHVDDSPFREDERNVLEHGEVIHNRVGHCIIQGVAHNIVASKEPIYENGDIVGLMGSFVSIDDLIAENGQPARIPIKDKLTGLMSGRGITNIISEYADGWTTRNENFAVIRISVTEYGCSTKTLGEKSARQTLIDMSRMIKDLFGRDGTCARLYADNFVVLIKCKDKKYVKSISNMILERLKKLHMLSGDIGAVNPEVQIYFADEVQDLQYMLNLAYGGTVIDMEKRKKLEG